VRVDQEAFRPLYKELEAHDALVGGYERFRSANTAYLAGIKVEVVPPLVYSRFSLQLRTLTVFTLAGITASLRPRRLHTATFAS
jgi:hypothetical protein